MADGERSVAADTRKRARQNEVVQPLLTGRLSGFIRMSVSERVNFF